ncbi:SpoVG family protein [Lachnotalea glycerini]|uniref:Septation protein spoVG n=1 Tax=Lachnotalea glycerini TaxID=1763509 RepID=A0A371JBK7_9FIRM|nr:SpoVG family protein [Lachnotalea glycerini]RDY30139.1 septation protein spoVG [Lachnotalea glycerini]
MKYSIHVNEVKRKENQGGEQVSPLRGFASLVFGDSFKITNIAILENSKTGNLFVSMPRYKTSGVDETGNPIYKDICNPITKEFREEQYRNILEAFEKRIDGQGKAIMGETTDMLDFSVRVNGFEKEGSSILGLARVYFEDSFVVNNVSIFQGKDEMFVAMPSYKTNQIDDGGKAIYQDICFPVAKEFREKLYTEIVCEYEQTKKKNQNQVIDNVEKQVGSKEKQQGKENTPFR